MYINLQGKSDWLKTDSVVGEASWKTNSSLILNLTLCLTPTNQTAKIPINIFIYAPMLCAVEENPLAVDL